MQSVRPTSMAAGRGGSASHTLADLFEFLVVVHDHYRFSSVREWLFKDWSSRSARCSLETAVARAPECRGCRGRGGSGSAVVGGFGSG
jgi:hypothetical protein